MEKPRFTWNNYDFYLEDILGEGQFGQVYLTGANPGLCCGKIIPKEKTIDPRRKELLEREIAVLNKISKSSNPNLLKLIDHGMDDKNYYLMTNYCNGGNLDEYLKELKEKKIQAFSEEMVQHVMKGILNGLNYLHKNNILHRDLKLQNIMIHYKSEEDRKNRNIFNSDIVIVDYGFARFLKPGESAKSKLGSPSYMDPNLIRERYNNRNTNESEYEYDQKLDIWSLGILCYKMLVGCCAFSVEDLKQLIDNEVKRTYYLPTNIHRETYGFIKSMLNLNPEERPDTEILLNHPFITKKVSSFTKMDLRGMEIVGSFVKENVK